MIRLIIDGKEADLLNNDFTWNMQCADFFSFDTRQFSCSDVMYLPMSGTNNDIFELASMVGNVSNRPQRAFDVELLIDGIPIVRHAKGYLMGVQNDTYKFAFHESTKDIYHWLNLYKLSDVIGNKLNHSKAKDTIIETSYDFANKSISRGLQDYNYGYIYAVAEYGGDTLPDEGILNNRPSGMVYNFYYTPPSIHLFWIFKEVQRMSGYEFDGRFIESHVFKSLFITTSQVLKENAPGGELVRLYKEENVKGEGKKLTENTGELYLTINTKDNPTYYIKKRYKDYIYKIPEDKLGVWDFNLSGNIQGNGRKIKCYVDIYKNGDMTPICSTESGVGGYVTKWEYNNNIGGFDFSIRIPDYFRVGDEIYVRLRAEIEGGFIDGKDIATKNLDFKIEQTSWQSVNNLVSELSMLDLFKELLVMFGLTPMKLSIDDNVQHFYTIDERLNEAPVLDWTDKFVRVTNLEFHTPSSSYARHNHFKYKKYDEQENAQSGADGVLVIEDDLLTFKKEREGKFFAGVDYDKSRKAQFGGWTLDEFHFWEKEVKEKESGGQKTVETTYKAKDNRFHIFSVEHVGDAYYKDNGIIKGGNTDSGKFQFIPCFAYFDELKWGKLLENYYSGFNEILNRMRVYTCEIDLNALDIYEFNFFKRIYLMQLGGYFLPNKITFKTNTLAIVELIKIEPI